MNKFARIENNVAVEIFTPPEGFAIGDCFHPDIAAKFSQVPDNVTAGSTRKGTVWTIAVQEVQPEVGQIPPAVGPIRFQMLFTPQEASKANELRNIDAILAAFWKLVDDPRTDVIDMALESVQNAIEYTLSVVKAAGVDVDVAARKAEILTGVLN